MKIQALLVTVCVLLFSGCSSDLSNESVAPGKNIVQVKPVKSGFKVHAGQRADTIVSVDATAVAKTQQQDLSDESSAQIKAPPLEFILYLLTLKH